MARYTGPVCKLCRREGMKLYLKADKCFTKCVLDRRPYAPGTSTKRKTKVSDYALRLREKQKLGRMTGVLETQMRHYYTQAASLSGRTGENILRLLEVRLDNIVKKVGLATSLRFARQMVNHGHIKVNGKRVTIASYGAKPGDKIEIDQKMRDNFHVKLSLESFAKRGSVLPSWIQWDAERFEAQVLRSPENAEFAFPINDQYIVEHYTRR